MPAKYKFVPTAQAPTQTLLNQVRNRILRKRTGIDARAKARLLAPLSLLAALFCVADNGPRAAEPDSATNACAESFQCLSRGECVSAPSGCRAPETLEEFRSSLESVLRLNAAWRKRFANPEVAYQAAKALQAEKQLAAARELLDSVGEVESAMTAKRIRDLQHALSAEITRLDAASLATAQVEEALSQLVERERTIDSLFLQLHARVEFPPEWVQDRYGDRYHYFTAERGNTFAVVPKLVVRSPETEKDPRLPQVAVYRLRGDLLQHLATLDWAIYEWEDYSTYLGNEPDIHNSFKTSAEVAFTLGAEIPEGALEDPLVFLVSVNRCVKRSESRFGRPPIRYKASGCPTMPKSMPAKALLLPDTRFRVMAFAK